MTPEYDIVSISGLAPGAIAHRQVATKVEIALRGPARNAVFQTQKLTAGTKAVLGSLLLDLLDIASVAFLGDIASPRGRNEDWSRSLRIIVPVRHLEKWLPVADLLEELLTFLTEDAIELTLLPSIEPQRDEKLSESAGSADCVSLFSGGLDSFAGAAELLAEGRRPLLVGHVTANPWVREAQTELHDVLAAQTPHQINRIGVQVSAHSSRGAPLAREREDSQRSRSFLFLTLAYAAARLQCVKPEIHIHENGVMAVHVPMTAARGGSSSTRTAHPHVIDLFRELIAQVFGDRVDILNRFMYKTKGESIAVLASPPLSGYVNRSISCWRIARTNRKHCGTCIPCLLRQLALIHNGLAPDDCIEDAFTAYPAGLQGSDRNEKLRNLVDLLGYIRDFLHKTNGALLMDYPDLLIDELGGDTHEALNLHRRFSREAARVIRGKFPALAQNLN